MEHLSPERLSALVDEEPTVPECIHLASCRSCTSELDALRGQSVALKALPELLPPRGDWDSLEAELRAEGLINSFTLSNRPGFGRIRGRMKSVAMLLLFLAGAGSGALVTGLQAPDRAEAKVTPIVTVQDAATAVRLAEQRYASALSEYRQLLAAGGGEGLDIDPVNRFAALEHLVQVSQAAVRQAPGDPFLNGFLASAMAERDAAFRLVSSGRDDWF